MKKKKLNYKQLGFKWHDNTVVANKLYHSKRLKKQYPYIFAPIYDFINNFL